MNVMNTAERTMDTQTKNPKWLLAVLLIGSIEYIISFSLS
jgi:hypothetical protein